MSNRYLIWFNSSLKIDDADLKDWIKMTQPEADVFWSGIDKRFEHSIRM